MIKKVLFFISVLVTLVLIECTTTKDGRYFKRINKTDNGYLIETNDVNVEVRALSSNAIEIHYITEGSKHPSNALIEASNRVETKLKKKRKEIIVSTNDLEVRINKSPFQISFYRGDSLLTKEEEGLFGNDSIQGFKMHLNNTEKLMGGGERVLGMDRRGRRLHLYNKASYGYETEAELMYYSMPLIVSSKKYYLFFDNGAEGYLDLGKTEANTLSFEAFGGRMSYVVVADTTWNGLVQEFTGITGRQPMPPRWSLGNIASRMGYHTQKEVESVAQKYLEDDFPLDGIVLDLYWFGPDLKGHMGNLEWDKKAFPEPEKMMKDLKNKGIKTVLITEPFILKNAAKFPECAEQNLFGTDSLNQPYIFDFYFGTTALLDMFKPETKSWFWSVYKQYTNDGVEGWWGDLGEPEVHPHDLNHVNGTAREVHNLYGHEWAKTIYEGYKTDFKQKRPLILMRSGFIGSQCYGMIPWSGDVNRTWGGLKPQVEISLQMGLQGLAFMHSDLGGFAGDYKDAELYTRWLQYGVFQPIYRTHAQEEVPAEPVFWDAKTKDIVRAFIKLRYALTPYFYSMVYENASSGLPLMRPLFFEEDNIELINNNSTYLWGDNFLVSPITTKGETKHRMYLPKGSNWYNYWTNEELPGGQHVEVETSLETIPVFVKGGAFIPMVEPVQNMEEYSTSHIKLHYYFDRDVTSSKGLMYDDDGKTTDLSNKNKSAIIHFESQYVKGNVKLILKRDGESHYHKNVAQSVEIIIHNMKSKPVAVKSKVGEIEFSYDEKSNLLSIPIEFKESIKEISIEL